MAHKNKLFSIPKILSEKNLIKIVHSGNKYQVTLDVSICFFFGSANLDVLNLFCISNTRKRFE